MASGLSFCFSSPPHPTPNTWERSATNYYTPQQPLRSTWSSTFAPPSPSPLRTSKNANLMSSPVQGGDLFSKHAEQDQSNENTFSTENPAFTPSVTSNQDPSTSFSTNTSGFTTPFHPEAPAAPTFSFGAASTSSTDNSLPPTLPTTHDKPIFQFSARARSSSPATLLQTHTRDNRESRKRLFLDRLRSKRDDSRSERMSDQVLRMDFMRERKLWEAEMERQELGVVDVDEMSDDEPGMEAMEEKEIEELVEGYYSMQRETQRRDGNEVDEEFSDDGYDEAFMEVLSQETPATSRAEEGLAVHSTGTAFGFTPGGSHGFGPADSAMDMS